MPQLKYPANPPAIGEPETFELRTTLYFIMMAVSVISAIMALSTGRQLARRFGIWNGALAGSAAYIAAVVAAMSALPTVNNDLPSGFPATTLWSYRLASIGTEAVLWGTIGVVFGALVNRKRRF